MKSSPLVVVSVEPVTFENPLVVIAPADPLLVTWIVICAALPEPVDGGASVCAPPLV